LTVATARRGDVLIVTIQRPDVRNAVDGDVAMALDHAVDELEGAPDLRVGVLTAAGEVFCAGADLRAVAERGPGVLSTPRGGFAGFVRRSRRKPFIAAVNGPAVGGGAELAFACDVVVASTSASFTLPELRRSLLPAAGGLARIAQWLPAPAVAGMVLTGEPLDARRARDLGLVWRLAEPGRLIDEALSVAAAIARGAPLAVAEAMAALKLAGEEPIARVWQTVDEAMVRLRASEDYEEGRRAFLEHRTPAWARPSEGGEPA
jgi:enoyl-CoA hydratase